MALYTICRFFARFFCEKIHVQTCFYAASEPLFNFEMKSEKMREREKNKEKIKETEIYFKIEEKNA